jgi:NADH-quinone oxidoreductase subunit K
MRRASADCRTNRRADSRDGGKTMTPTLQVFLIVSAALFSIGLLAALSRRHAIFILIGIEMMLAAANVNFIAFWRFGPQHQPPIGVMIALFSIAIAAAEAAVGLAMVIAVYRHYHTTNVDQFDQLKG